MGATIKISSLLQSFVEIPERVKVSGTSVQECLRDLVLKFPKMNNFIFDRNGAAKVIVTVNGKFVPQSRFDTTVSDSDELSILMPMDGG